MPSNAFHDHELVAVGGGKKHPVVGARLRLAHDNGLQGVHADIVAYEARSHATVKATVVVNDCPYTGHGFADAKRDARHIDALLEMAETRAVARALRFAGFGMEFTGFEELTHLDKADKPARQDLGSLAANAADPGADVVAAIKAEAKRLGVDADGILAANPRLDQRRQVLANMKDAEA